MLQIKTIYDQILNAYNFDQEVNTAITEGWTLTKREVLLPNARPVDADGCIVLYAELERDVITEAERVCENCKHYDLDPNMEPCRNCNDSPNNYPTKWEPIER